MKQEANVYVNVTWIETIEYEARSKCLCECYMNWNHWIWSKKDLFIWMLHELKPLNIKQKKGNVYVNVTWIETIE
jgi:hypothetical protein